MPASSCFDVIKIEAIFLFRRPIQQTAISLKACNFFKIDPIYVKFETLVELNKPLSEIAKPEVEIEIQDGCRRHLENAQIAISQEPFDRFHSYLNHRCITAN